MNKNKKKDKILTLTIIAIIILISIAGCFLYAFHDKLPEKLKSITPDFSMPTDYKDLVLKYSEEYNMDPKFVFSIIYVESKFNPDVTSAVGARGLMQIMKESYDWIAFRLNDKRVHTFDNMYEPELNIQYGTYMLHYLYEKFDHSYELTAAAYNGGMNAVDNWINDGTINPDNFRIEDVPPGETSYYIQKVMKAYSKYKQIPEEDLKNEQK